MPPYCCICGRKIVPSSDTLTGYSEDWEGFMCKEHIQEEIEKYINEKKIVGYCSICGKPQGQCQHTQHTI